MCPISVDNGLDKHFKYLSGWTNKAAHILCGLEGYPSELPTGDKPLLPSCCSDSNGDRSPSAIAKICAGENSNLGRDAIEEAERSRFHTRRALSL